jgi:hypothetical protein
VDKTCPTVPSVTAEIALVPLPNKIPVNVVAPVPPLATPNVPPMVIVPLVVIGEFVTVNPVGTLNATDVTVPVVASTSIT